MARQKKYTNAQKFAFKTGKAYRLGRDNKVITFKNEKNKQSFEDGYRFGGKTKHKKIVGQKISSIDTPLLFNDVEFVDNPYVDGVVDTRTMFLQNFSDKTNIKNK